MRHTPVGNEPDEAAVETPTATGGALVLFAGTAAASPEMARPLTGRHAAELTFDAFAAASGKDVGAVASSSAEDELGRDQVCELAVVATEAAELERRQSRVGRLQPLRHPVYSAMHGGRIETPEEGWRLLVDHLYRPQRFGLAFATARADGLARCVELGPSGTLNRAVQWLARGEIEVETFPTAEPETQFGGAQR